MCFWLFGLNLSGKNAELELALLIPHQPNFNTIANLYVKKL